MKHKPPTFYYLQITNELIGHFVKINAVCTVWATSVSCSSITVVWYMDKDTFLIDNWDLLIMRSAAHTHKERERERESQSHS